MKASHAVGLALLAALPLAACGGDRDSSTAAADVAGATVGGGPAGGVLLVLADREPDQLNPITFESTPAYHAVHLIFRALAARDSTLSGFKPDLAQSWELEGDSVVVLKLRRDVKWEDGVPVTADDVIFTIERQRDPATGSPWQAAVTAVEHATARDSFTVAVRLSRTSLYTINALLEVVPAPKHLLGDIAPADLRRAPFNRRPVGNGYYRFESWVPGQRLTLVANPQKPDGRAAIQRVVMRFLPDITAAMTEMLTGQGDLVAKVPPDQRARIEATKSVRLVSGPRVRPAWLAWNTRTPPLDDVRVRRALLMGIDRAELVRALFGGIGEAAYSPIPAALREHSSDVRPIPFDPAGARRLLAQAGWRDSNGDGVLDRGGRPLHIEVDFISTDQTRRDVLVAIQSMLRRIGVDLAPSPYESTAWVQRLREGKFQGSFWGWGWGPGVVGPNAEMVFHSRSIPPNGPNFAAARDARLDQLIDQALVATDTAIARGIWREAEQRMIDDAVYAPIYMDPELFAVHSRFANVRFRGIEWTEDAPYWFIPADKRLGRDRS